MSGEAGRHEHQGRERREGEVRVTRAHGMGEYMRDGDSSTVQPVQWQTVRGQWLWSHTMRREAEVESAAPPYSLHCDGDVRKKKSGLASHHKLHDTRLGSVLGQGSGV